MLTLAPITGALPVVRLSAVLTPVVLAVVLFARPWTWRDSDWERLRAWDPPVRVIVVCAASAALLLSWIVLTRFLSGEINAVDFTIYFDRPLFQTTQGNVLFVESTDDTRFSNLTHLAVHAYWLLVPLSALYLVHPSPLWLLAISVAAPVLGAVHMLRVGRQLGFGSPLAGAAAILFLFNDNTARTLNYGFHPEVLYCWFVPWLLDAGLRRARGSFAAAVLLSILVKEDAIFPLLASSIALALVRGARYSWSERALFLIAPPAFALANLAFYYSQVVPALSPTGSVMYGYFWENSGPTPMAALAAMIGGPTQFLMGTFESGLLRVVLPPFLFLPLVGWRWSIGTVPLLLIYSASASPQVRGFGIYYSIVLVPFYVLATGEGAIALARRCRDGAAVRPVLALCLVLGGLLVGSGYSLRPWKAQIAAMPEAMKALEHERVVLVQSGLYPHAGYDSRVQLLTPDSLNDPANAEAAVLVARGVSAYPFEKPQWTRLFRRHRIVDLPCGLVAVRVKKR